MDQYKKEEFLNSKEYLDRLSEDIIPLRYKQVGNELEVSCLIASCMKLGVIGVFADEIAIRAVRLHCSSGIPMRAPRFLIELIHTDECGYC